MKLSIDQISQTFKVKFNNNIRCIEIAAAIAANASMAKFNNNIRCIEIMKPINDELKAIPV